MNNRHKQQPPAGPSSRWRARVTLIGIVTLFFGPVLAAIWLNAYAPHWQPFGTINQGDLVSPAVPVQATALQALDGQTLSANFWTGRWTLVYVGGKDCDSNCETALVRMRQVRLALGKDSDRVQRALVLAPGAGHSRVIQLLKQFPGLRIFTNAPGSALVNRGLESAGAITLIDPRSFMIMHFPPALSSSAMLKDMQRLVKLAKRD